MKDLFNEDINENGEEMAQPQVQQSAWYQERSTEIGSAYFKAMRLGLVEEALYWMLIMLENGEKHRIACLLIEIAVEDVISPTAIIMAKAVYDCVGCLKEVKNHFVRTTIVMCRAKKWYQDEEGRKDVAIWERLEKEIEGQKESGGYRKIPKWAVDGFTKAGRQALKDKNWAMYCGKFGGTWKGWNTIAKLYVEGKLGDEIFKESTGVL